MSEIELKPAFAERDIFSSKPRSKRFDLDFSSEKLLIFFASVIFVFCISVTVFAQPSDCASYNWKIEKCKEKREVFLKQYKIEIENLSRKIRQEPKNSELYFQRGKVYTTMMFVTNFGFKTVEFDGKIYFSEIDTKAVADFTKAISLAPKAEYYEERGKIYRAYWDADVSEFSYLPKEELPKVEILRIIGEIFLANKNFTAAENDFINAIELSANDEKSADVRANLAGLYSLRGYYLSENPSVAQKIADEKAAEIALADFDRVIDYYKNFLSRYEPFWVNENTRENYRQSVKLKFYLVWLAKGGAAVKFGRDSLALECFYEAEKYWEKWDFGCDIFRARASVYLKQNNFDAALRDLSFAVESGNPNCIRIVRFRGDVYFRRENWQAAIEDYTTFLNSETGKRDEEIFIRRGRAFLKIGEADKAASDFSIVIDKLYHQSCPQIYNLRAEAYKLSGKTDLAEADEKRARKLSENSNNSWCQDDL